MAARQQDTAPGSQQAGSQQLQRGHSVWLAPERFEAKDFSPDQCVAELRRYVSVDTRLLATLGGMLVVRTSADMSVFAGPTPNSQGRTADAPCSPEEQGASHCRPGFRTQISKQEWSGRHKQFMGLAQTFKLDHSPAYH
jgi:hypothetical protein